MTDTEYSAAAALRVTDQAMMEMDDHRSREDQSQAPAARRGLRAQIARGPTCDVAGHRHRVDRWCGDARCRRRLC
jgi:hypothetical protein